MNIFLLIIIYEHLVYEGKFQDVFKKSIGDYINKNNDKWLIINI